MDEKRLSELLGRLGDQMDDDRSVPSGLRRRVRGRIARNMLAAGGAVAAVVVIGILGATAIGHKGPHAAPPAQAPSDSPSQVARKDGEIAFLSERGEGDGQDVFVMRSDGTDLRQVTTSGGFSSRVSWSPEGEQIVFDRGEGEGGGSLIVANVQTGDTRVLLSDQGSDAPLNPQGPAWSPDGSRIAFFSGDGDIYVVPAEGGSPERVTDPPDGCGDLYPAWSPDGSRIAFSRDCSDGGIFVVSVSSGNLARITSTGGDLRPAWSPDGDRIAFGRGSSDGSDIFVVDVAAAAETQLTDAASSYSPSWSPDGSAITFGTNRDGTQDIWIMDDRGDGESPLTQDSAVDSSPAFAPIAP